MTINFPPPLTKKSGIRSDFFYAYSFRSWFDEWALRSAVFLPPGKTPKFYSIAGAGI
jgi:hypothetical protein